MTDENNVAYSTPLWKSLSPEEFDALKKALESSPMINYPNIKHLTLELMKRLRVLYGDDPGGFENEMEGDDEWSGHRVEDEIEKFLSEYI